MECGTPFQESRYVYVVIIEGLLSCCVLHQRDGRISERRKQEKPSVFAKTLYIVIGDDLSVPNATSQIYTRFSDMSATLTITERLAVG